MSAVEVSALTKRFETSGPPALDAVAFDVADGSITCLLGPSGSGKSTVLGCIAGLIEPDAGRIAIGGRDVRGVPVHRRPATLLMQQAQLFGHLSVVENVEFGLRVRRVDRGRRRRRAVELLELVGLAHLQDRSPLHLSGGEQQRVALARALAVDPEVLLADEPLASLDPEIRRSLQDLLVQVRRELGSTILLVTHDVGEALALADQLVVLAGGQTQVQGSPSDLLARPHTETAARLLGLRNVIRGAREGDGLRTSFGFLATSADRPPAASSAADQDQGVVVIDPRRVRIVDAPGPNRVAGDVVDTRLLGVEVEATVSVDGTELTAVVRAGDAEVGASVHLELPDRHLVEVSATPQPP